MIRRQTCSKPRYFRIRSEVSGGKSHPFNLLSTQGVEQGGSNSLGFFEFRRAKKRGSSSWAKATITGFGGKIKVEGLEGGEVGNSKRRERAI